ncbi:MAG TPA: chromosome segregation ATPase [Cyanobacteria bacterium UBA8803]|nr:chromosome segregation ATPase [Cyanobacteria bacterium UBA9273]HBL57648.1 chromosome segregation ATPase [Cyanobacteria bacterium UBA8803]
MTRNREMPDPWSGSPSSQPSQVKGWHPGGQPAPANQAVPQQVATSTVSASPPTKQPQERRRKFTLRWPFWAVVAILTSGGVGFASVALLLKLPAVPNCPAIFWPTASASIRMYCAQLAANKQTVDDLLEAIALVEALPETHPLRPEINRYTEQWSLDILKIGEEKFQAGQLSEAIKIAKRIPAQSKASQIVEDRIELWQTTWAKAETIYEKAEEQLRQSNWNQAFREAVRLTSVDNKYWASVKYNQLVDLIQIAREASQQLDKAYQLSKSNRVEDILAAIKEAEKISPKSFAYKEAQDLIADCGNKLLKLAKNRLEQRNWQGVLEIANKIPDSLKLAEAKSDLIDLANGLSRASSGTIADLEAAIASVKKLGSERPFYNEGQELINRWQREVEDVARLEKARTLASSGVTSDIRSAIAEAQQIPQVNPRYQEARQAISRWTSQVETIEDRPYLDRANQIASLGGETSLQEAIQEARRIAPGRALYQEAQTKIREWTSAIQRMQDQPYLDQARTLANSGNIPNAISAAQQIKPGRTLYGEAQNNIRRWQIEIEGQQRLQEAYQAANPGTPEALSSAIRTARQVPSGAKVRGDALTAANRWSYQLLSLAQDRSSFNVAEAIAIAKMIPSGTEAYEAAQQQIQAWQRSLEPVPVPSTLELSPPSSDTQSTESQ